MSLSPPAMIRAGGRAVARTAPGLDGALRALYQRLPPILHDTPTRFLARYFRSAAQVRFIQLGAHDGRQGDPLYELIVGDARWTGVLAEPNPTAFAALSKTHRNGDRIRLKRAAVSDVAGARRFYSFASTEDMDPSELRDWWSEISSFDPAHLKRYLPERLHGAIRGEEVEVVTVAQMMDEFGLSGLDLLVMDIEGHEAAILRSLAGLPHAPRLIMFEHKHMTPQALIENTAWFRGSGYRLKMYGRDAMLYARRPPG